MLMRWVFTSFPETSWKYAIAVQPIFATILLFGCFLIPESPRWLVSSGLTIEAANVLRKYHQLNSENAKRETFDIEQSYLKERSINSGQFISLFTKLNRNRTIVVISISYFAQVSGTWIV
ncbi:hypothetical protein HK096_009554, partial [Nowakowskiella sp. JEL0078]